MHSFARLEFYFVAFDKFKKCLLDTFAGYITGNRGVSFVFGCFFINFINENDAVLS